MTIHTRADLSRLPDRLLLALLIWGEARGEPVDGQLGVAVVVRNRALRTGHNWAAVILADRQFSCFNESDPNFPRVLRAANVLLAEAPTADLTQALWIADGVIGNLALDNTHGAQNYLTTALLQSEHAPSWAVGRPILATIGGHSFLTA